MSRWPPSDPVRGSVRETTVVAETSCPVVGGAICTVVVGAIVVVGGAI